MNKINTAGESKALFWNIWCGRQFLEQKAFLESCAPQTDIFCLTEVSNVDDACTTALGTNQKFSQNKAGKPEDRPDLVDCKAQLRRTLASQHHDFYSASRGSDWTCTRFGTVFPRVEFGSSLFYHKDLELVQTDHSMICCDIPDIRPRVVQWIVYAKNRTRYLVAHLHGIWLAENTKGDHYARMVQSVQLLSLVASVAKTYQAEKIIFGGDFNLDINTKALSFLHDCKQQYGGPFRNLIEEYGVVDTRTKLYRKYDWPGESKYADYVFVGSNVAVSKFEVDNSLLASDHAPILIQYE